MNAVWPLLSGVKPNDPNVAPPFVDPREVLEGEPQVEEGVLDDMPAVPAPSRLFFSNGCMAQRRSLSRRSPFCQH